MAKRETNAERRAREDQQRAIFKIAFGIAESIHTKKAVLSLSGTEMELADFAHKVLNSANPAATRIDGEWIKTQPLENIAQSFRLAADILEERPPDGRVLRGHDHKMRAAYHEAFKRLLQCDGQHRLKVEVQRRRIKDEIDRMIEAKPTLNEILERFKALFDNEVSLITSAPRPTFSEFVKVYREQNPRVRVEGRTLRRSLKRLGLPTLPDKRGRPKGK